MAAEDVPVVHGVRIDCGEVEPLLVGAVGQLTLNGEPVPGTMFALLCHEDQVLDSRYFLSRTVREKMLAERGIVVRRAIEEGRLDELQITRDDAGVRANGAEIAFIRGARGIVLYHIQAAEFRLEKPYLLLEKGVEDPPGEAAVAFF